MLFEYAIDPATVIEWAKDDRLFRQFKTAFGYGKPRLISNFPKRKKWRKLVLSLLAGDMSPREQKRVEAILTAFKGQPVVERDGPQYEGTECWSSNILEQHDWVRFNHLFIAENTDCDADCAFTVEDTFGDEKDCWKHERQQLICRQAEDVGRAIGNMLRLSDRVLIVDPFFRSEHGQMRVLREMLSWLLSDRPHNVKPVVEIFYNLDKQGARSPNELHLRICAGIENQVLEKIGLIVHGITDSKMHNRYVLTEHGGVKFGHSLSEDPDTTDEIELLSAKVYPVRWENMRSKSSLAILERTRPRTVSN